LRFDDRQPGTVTGCPEIDGWYTELGLEGAAECSLGSVSDLPRHIADARIGLS